MFCFDLDDLESLFNIWPITTQNRFGLGWFRRTDFIGQSDSPLKDYVLDQASLQLGFRPDGRVTLLTHIRLWGIMMNPIAIFSCYGKQGDLQAVALQVTNTPWGEQCLYMLRADPKAAKQHFRFNKSMHVSPFHPMDMSYVCHYMLKDEKLIFHLENHQDDQCVTDATLVMDAQVLDRKKLIESIFLYPYMTGKVYFGIYKQALSLFLKRNPIHDHPSSMVKQQKYSQGT